jgi:signal transduction histidine kinase/CheY-like chemotaxis protein
MASSRSSIIFTRHGHCYKNVSCRNISSVTARTAGPGCPVSTRKNAIPDPLQDLKREIIVRWREEVRQDPDQPEFIRDLEDQEFTDHFPSLAEKVIKLLRGQSVESVEGEAAQHGRQRRSLGYSVVQVLRELQTFRRVLADSVQRIVGPNIKGEALDRSRKAIVDIVDRSMNVSVAQYIAAAEEERNSAQDEAKQLHAQRDRFLVTLSHELRNQVSPILLSTQLLKQLQPTDGRMEKAVERIERQARHQAILIDDLLDMSRFRYGKLKLRRKLVDLRKAIQHALETFQTDFQTQQLKISVDLPERPMFVFADATRIVQVLVNLLSNSIKFTPAEGTIEVRLAQEDETVVLSVRDRGVGISADLLPQLFKMFLQGEESSQGVNTGLGVGLALAKILVEMHDGTIEAHSAGVGKGAEFVVRLPLPDMAAQETSQPRARRVLLVEDNPDQLASLSELLKLNGYEVIEARDASEALRVVSEHKPDACVIDIGLPDMNGYELARKLREIPGTRNSRLVAVTGYGNAEDSETFMQAGFDHYLPKPPDLNELNRILSED